MHLILRRLFPALLLFPFAAQGNVVTTSTDEDDGSLGGGTGISLREAVNYSAAGDTITFDAALSGQIIRLTLGQITIAQSLTIDGSSLASRIILSGDKTGDGKTADDTRVIQIANNTTVVLDSLTVTEGSSTSGGGIWISGLSNGTTNASVRNCTFVGNFASEVGGAIDGAGNINIQNSSFTGNIAKVGAGIFVQRGAATVGNTIFSSNSATNEGGAIYSLGTLIVRNSTLTANSALVGSGIFTGSSAATIETTAVTGNLSRASGGGIYNSGSHVTFRNSICSGNQADLDGGGVYHYFGTLLIENSTLTGNVAKRGAGGIYVGGQTVTLRNATVSGNTANTTAGGGIANRSATLTLDNSIVAGNAALNAPLLPDISGSYTGSNNITSGNPFLAPLGDYGGPTQTMPPLPDSPAIDAGGTTTLLTDQRGFPRVGTPDIGAVESQGIADLARFWNRDFDGDGLPYGVEQALGTDNFAADPANSRNLAPPVFDASGHTILSFGLASAALQGTRWILSRSLDLTSGSFAEIYRFDGITDTVSPGVDYIRSASRVTIADSNPPPGSAFYRFEAVLEP